METRIEQTNDSILMEIGFDATLPIRNHTLEDLRQCLINYLCNKKLDFNNKTDVEIVKILFKKKD